MHLTATPRLRTLSLSLFLFFTRVALVRLCISYLNTSGPGLSRLGAVPYVDGLPQPHISTGHDVAANASHSAGVHVARGWSWNWNWRRSSPSCCSSTASSHCVCGVPKSSPSLLAVVLPPAVRVIKTSPITTPTPTIYDSIHLSSSISLLNPLPPIEVSVIIDDLRIVRSATRLLHKEDNIPLTDTEIVQILNASRIVADFSRGSVDQGLLKDDVEILLFAAAHADSPLERLGDFAEQICLARQDLSKDDVELLKIYERQLLEWRAAAGTDESPLDGRDITVVNTLGKMLGRDEESSILSPVAGGSQVGERPGANGYGDGYGYSIGAGVAALDLRLSRLRLDRRAPDAESTISRTSVASLLRLPGVQDFAKRGNMSRLDTNTREKMAQHMRKRPDIYSAEGTEVASNQNIAASATSLPRLPTLPVLPRFAEIGQGSCVLPTTLEETQQEILVGLDEEERALQWLVRRRGLLWALKMRRAELLKQTGTQVGGEL
ncbi:Ff.00g065640.m01.CDS01 [Fusarium sp. VM40]|nr:Ff.00g065640.m01.CDS01 [Fusarium sp. VM40]